MRKYILLFSTLLIVHVHMSAQGYLSRAEFDSLWAIWHDTSLDEQRRMYALLTLAHDAYLYSAPDSAFYYAEIAYAYAKASDNKNLMSAALNTMGSALDELGNIPRAIAMYKELLQINRVLDDKEMLAVALNNIGTVYEQIGDYDAALIHYSESLKLAEEHSVYHIMPMVVSNIGNIYYKREMYDVARTHYERSLEMEEKNGDKSGMAGSLVNLALVCVDEGKYEQAFHYHQRALKLREEIDQTTGIAHSKIALGELFQKMARYREAIPLCLDGLAIAEATNVVQLRRNAFECLYQSYKAMKNDSKALEYLEKKEDADRELQKEEAARQLQRLGAQRAMFQDSLAWEEEARLIEEAHREEMRKRTQTRNIALLSTLVFVIVSGALYSRWRYVRKAKAMIEKERDRSENLLINILPEEIATELKEKGHADARDYDTVSILFTDFKGFTRQSEKLTASELVGEINQCFKVFDQIVEKYGIEKIKTIGDAYMAAGGLPTPTEDSVKKTVLAALEMQQFITKRKEDRETRGEPAFEMRVGIHTGPVVAGIVGVKKFQYDIWGDTVNTANRMESRGEAGRVNVSHATYEHIKNTPDFKFESRGKLAIKGKGEMEMWFVDLA